MAARVQEISLVSPLGISPSEHVFFFRAEVAPHASGAFTDRDGESLPVHDCPWIPAARPWASRLRVLAKQALARLGPLPPRTPVLLVAPAEAVTGDAELVRFLERSGHLIAGVRSGAAGYVSALAEARELLKKEEEAVVIAVDSLLSRGHLEPWLEIRYSAFTRNPPPPSEGAAGMRFVRDSRAPLAGKVHTFAAARSKATDENDLPTDGADLARVFAELDLPARVPLVVGPRDVDPLRIRDFHVAAVRHHPHIDGAEMVSLEGKVGLLGSAGGLMSAVFAMAWLRHGLPLPDAAADLGTPGRENHASRAEPQDRRVALAWARSADGTVGAALVGDEVS